MKCSYIKLFACIHSTALGQQTTDNNIVCEELYKITTSRLGNRSKNKTTIPTTHMDLAVGQRVMYTINTCTQLGLVNGAVGTVVGFGIPNDCPLPISHAERHPQQNIFHTLSLSRTKGIVVFVHFENLPTDLSISKSYTTGAVIPIFSIQYGTKLTVNCNTNTYYRCMLPIVPAAAITTHKAQSMTASNGAFLIPAASPTTMPTRGLSYVQISRCVGVNQLNTLGLWSQSHFCNAKFGDEYRLIHKFYDDLRKRFPTG